jgi:hypothetical protein
MQGGRQPPCITDLSETKQQQMLATTLINPLRQACGLSQEAFPRT